MELTPVLLILVAILAVISGFFVLFGAEKSRKVLAGLFFVLCAVFACRCAFILREDFSPRMVSGIVLYICLALSLIYDVVMMKVSMRTRPHKGWRVVFFSTLVLGACGAVIEYVLPLMDIRFEWVAMFAVAPLFLIYYYCAIRFKIFLISARALKFWTYAVLSAMSVIIYMIVFYFISKFLFHIETTNEIIALNLVMIIIVIMIFPIWNEINSEITSLISTQKINLNYVIKRLNSFAVQNANYDKLAYFLADHLHFRCVCLVVDGKIYGTKKFKLSAEDLAELTMLDAPAKSIWLDLSSRIKKIFDEAEIVAAAELRDAKGRPFGQILVGKPFGKVTFEKRDLNEVEMIVNLVASIIDSKEKIRS